MKKTKTKTNKQINCKQVQRAGPHSLMGRGSGNSYEIVMCPTTCHAHLSLLLLHLLLSLWLLLCCCCCCCCCDLAQLTFWQIHFGIFVYLCVFFTCFACASIAVRFELIYRVYISGVCVVRGTQRLLLLLLLCTFSQFRGCGLI